jgi:putative transposase
VSPLFQNRYRIESTRLLEWNYGSVGIYFITICTQGGNCWFGKIKKGEMHLSNAGKIVAREWIRTEEIRKRVTLDKWIIMPNHFHGIIILNKINGNDTVETQCILKYNHGIHPVETQCIASLQHQHQYQSTSQNSNIKCAQINQKQTLYQNANINRAQKNKFGPQQDNLASIIRGFKSKACINIRMQVHSGFKWQPRFFDHIIRTEKELNRIRAYIVNNPRKWYHDRNYSGKI